MDTHELLGRITRLPIVASGLAEDMLSGNFRSVFRGQGLEFDEARHYQWGDDAKAIDWNASARLGTPFIKMYKEERELSILLLLDTSASMHTPRWGDGTAAFRRNSQNLRPYEQALIAAALIAFSAERSGQRVGAILFDREMERVFPPRKGRQSVLAIVSGALQYHNSEAAKARADNTSNLRSAIAGTERMLKRRSMVVILSDFLSIGWEQELNQLCRKHDVIVIRVSDPYEEDLSDMGLITIIDPETGLRLTAPSGSASFRSAWAVWHRERADMWRNICGRAGAALLELPVNTDAVSALTVFFGGRSKR